MKNKKNLYMVAVCFMFSQNIHAELGIKSFISWLFLRNDDSKKNNEQISSQNSSQESKNNEIGISQNTINANDVAKTNLTEGAQQTEILERLCDSVSNGISLAENSSSEKKIDHLNEIFQSDVGDDIAQKTAVEEAVSFKKQENFSESEIDAIVAQLIEGNEPRTEEKEKFILVLEFLSTNELGAKKILSNSSRNGAKTHYMRIVRKWRAETIVDKNFANRVQELLHTIYLKSVS